jgi:IrrE N-terminal-like domain
MISHDIERLAAGFWEEWGKDEPFPRDLEIPIHYLRTSVAICDLPMLCPPTIRNYLQERGHLLALTTPRRWLDGCFYGHKELGFIFLEQNLEPERRRVVLAHEFGHFLAHYEAPRQRAARRLGAAVVPVLDGERPASAAERLSASLSGVRLSSYLHFMDRNEDGSHREPVTRAEQTADELGLELLAPWRAVFARLRTGGTWPGTLPQWKELLATIFGLPQDSAGNYGQRLLRMARGRLGFSEALGL